MPNTTTIRLTLPPLAATTLAEWTNDWRNGDVKTVLSKLEQLIHKIRSGAYQGAAGPITGEWSGIEIQPPGAVAVRARQTFNYSAAATAGKKCTINAVDFTAKAALPLGANEFLCGATDVESAHNLAAAINGSGTAGIVGTVYATCNGSAAFATAKCTTVIATDALVVGPVTFTVKAAVPSGTYTYIDENNADVLVGAADAAMATNFANAISSHPTTKPLVHATTAGGDTLTITANAVGAAGNLINLSTPDATITVSGANLASGTDTIGTGNGAINADASICTVYAMQPGSYMNAITTVTDDAGSCVAGGATMASGAGDNVVPTFIRI